MVANLTLPDEAHDGDPSHVTDHNLLANGLYAVNVEVEQLKTDVAAISTLYRLGNDSTAGAKTTLTRYRHHAQKISVATDSLLLAVELYCDNTGGSPFNVGPGLWADAAGTPGRLLAVGHVTTENALYWSPVSGDYGGPRWLTLTINAYLTAGDYWVGFYTHDSSQPDFGVYKTTGAANSSYYWLASGLWLTEGYTGITGSTDLWSIRALLLG